jgi:uncharacterized LabA/DUF88 family protein
VKVAIFFDGKNFYAGWRDEAGGVPLVFPKLAEWLVTRTGGRTLSGCHYYTGIETGLLAQQEGQKKLAEFLDRLELEAGFFVHRFPRKSRTYHCDSCGKENRFTQEKEVDTTMVADMLRLGAVNAFDVAVLVSGDADHAPAVEGMRQLGKIVYVSSWGDVGLSSRLRKAAFDHIDLWEALDQVSETAAGSTGLSLEDGGPWHEQSEPRTEARRRRFMPLHAHGREELVPSEPSAPRGLKAAFVEQLRAAEAAFGQGFVGAHYFLTRWRAPGFDAPLVAKRRILDELVEEGVVERYEMDGVKAIRLVPPP